MIHVKHDSVALMLTFHVKHLDSATPFPHQKAISGALR
jgi:hypothetical protein